MSIARFFQGWRHREILVVLGLGIISVVLWRIPLLGWLFYPFRLFNTFIHELGHGLAAIATGGAFQRFAVNPDLSGVAWSAGGIRWVVTSAGYVGSALFGGILTLLSAWNVPARSVLFWLGVVLGVLCLMFVRNLFGIATGLLLAAGLILAGQRLSAAWADGLLLFLAVQAMLNALDSLLDLVWISSSFGHAVTDARIMASATGIPAIFWALVWTMLSAGILVGTLLLAYRRTPAPVARQTSAGEYVTSADHHRIA